MFDENKTYEMSGVDPSHTSKLVKSRLLNSLSPLIVPLKYKKQKKNLKNTLVTIDFQSYFFITHRTLM